jgi:hypothetical protein
MLYSDLILGIGYNSNSILSGWNTPKYGDQDWTNVYFHKGTKGNFEANPDNTLQVYKTLKPLEINEPKEGAQIF